MARYRKRPVVVEAFQWTGDKNQTDDPTWIKEAVKKGVVSIFPKSPEGLIMMIDTLEGVMTAKPNDYIIRGVNGEFYPCKPDIFEKTYEPVSDSAYGDGG